MNIDAGIQEIFIIKQFCHLIFGITAADITPLLPFQAPANLATWETAWSIVFMLFGYPKADAAAVGLAVHTYSQLWEYSVGFIAFCIIVLPFSINKKKE